MGSEVNKNVPDGVIMAKICTCVYILGGDMELLAAIGSYKHSLSNYDVNADLDLWIEGALKERENNFKLMMEYSNR